MTIGDFLDKHFTALYILACVYVAGRFLGIIVLGWLKKYMEE